MAVNTLKFELVDIDSIREDPDNARLHPSENLKSIEASLKRFGQRKPIVVDEKTGIILAGNGTFRSANKLGWKQIWVAWSPLPLEEGEAYAIADNQLGLTSEWDVTRLSDKLGQLAEWNPGQDWEAIGFGTDELSGLLGSASSPTASAPPPEPKVNPFPDMKGAESESDEDIPDLGEPVRLTVEQREIIDLAVQVVRVNEDDPMMSEGRCLELVCADFLSSVRHEMGNGLFTAEELAVES